MQNRVHFLPILFFTGLLFIALLGSSCEKDVDPNEAINSSLDGDWRVRSWTANGFQQMNTNASQFLMEFKKDGPQDGELTWNIVFTDGSTLSINEDYEVSKSGTELEFLNSDFDIDLDRDDLDLEGTLFFTNGTAEVWVIKAERD